jgi:hypothetical protein
MTWIIGSIFLLFLVRFLWQSYTHRANVMARQAVHMGWVIAGRVPNANGGKDCLLSKNNMKSRIDWRTGTIWLVTPDVKTPFNDYVTIERWSTMKDAQHFYKFEEPEGISRVIKDFDLSVDDVIMQGESGQQILTLKREYAAVSTDYKRASIEVAKAAIEENVSPMMVATIYLNAFSAAAEVKNIGPVDAAAAYLSSVAKQMWRLGPDVNNDDDS